MRTAKHLHGCLANVLGTGGPYAPSIRRVEDDRRIGYGHRLADLARADGGAPALTLVSRDGTRDTLTYGALHSWSDAVAVHLQADGVSSSSTVVVALGNCLEQVVTTWAAWKLGSLVLPLSSAMPERERHAVLELARPTAVIAGWPEATVATEDLRQLRDGTAIPERYVTPHPGKAVGSGGSTGQPKIIVDPAPLAKVPHESLGPLGSYVGFHGSTVQLVPGPLYHNMPFTWLTSGLFEGQHVLLLDRFDAELLLDVVERDRVAFMTLVPTMMRRVMEVPDARTRDLSSLHGVLHSAAPCPETVKRFWIELVGPTRLFEGFGSTEAVGITLIRGDEWLQHPGSVGRGIDTEILILDEQGDPVPPGTVGEVFMRSGSPDPTYHYLGAAPAPSTTEGFVSMGDLGSLDEEGFLYPADRRVDLIITGGANVYPAEVEAVLLDHESVQDAVVIGLPDEDWGRRVHALIQPYEGRPGPTAEQLVEWCRRSLAPYKVPKSFEVLAELPRDEAGKIRRRALVEDRTTA